MNWEKIKFTIFVSSTYLFWFLIAAIVRRRRIMKYPNLCVTRSNAATIAYTLNTVLSDVVCLSHSVYVRYD